MKLILATETFQERWHRRLFGVHARRMVWCALVAVHVNLAAIILLATIWVRTERPPVEWISNSSLTIESTSEEPLPEELQITFTPPEAPQGLPLVAEAQPVPTLIPDAPEIPAPFAGHSAPPVPTLAQDRGPPQSPQILLTATDLKIGGGYEGRTAAARDRLAAARGGSPASEQAVERGLTWLAAHQRVDGGWSFDLQGTKCDGKCSHAGTHQSTTGATALALLAFLGAGQTHRVGEHQPTVERGLAYLISRIQPSARGADLQEGTMYAQGIATLALCEAYAITGDPRLHKPAQQALDFIVNVQHPLGGWRYFPGQPGDTTVLGWQLMALQSGRLAGLQIPDHTVARAHEFLDRVQAENGATYGYQSSGDEKTPSAVGLLCRMYHGWKRDDARLKIGIARLVERGPDFQDLYFTYYATQAVHHFDGPQWEQWNKRLRDRLVAQQVTAGHAAGSWHTPDYHTVAGGRLCDTALAIMILEVYYRHMPLYGYRGVEDFW